MNSHHYVPIEGKTHTWAPFAAVAVAATLGAVVGLGFSAASAETNLYTASAVRTVPAVQPQNLQRAIPASAVTSILAQEEVDGAVFQPMVEDQAAPATANWASLALMAIAAGVGYFLGSKKDVALAAATGSRVQAAPAAPEAAVVERLSGMLTPQGFYEEYELLVMVSPALSELEKEDRLATLEALFTQYKCKKVEKIDRGRRILSYKMDKSIEAYVVIYHFKAPRTVPKAIDDWFTGPGLNSDGNILRCFCTKNRPKKVQPPKAEGQEETPMWNV